MTSSSRSIIFHWMHHGYTVLIFSKTARPIRYLIQASSFLPYHSNIAASEYYDFGSGPSPLFFFSMTCRFRVDVLCSIPCSLVSLSFLRWLNLIAPDPVPLADNVAGNQSSSAGKRDEHLHLIRFSGDMLPDGGINRR